ncbi:DUF2628 domain-containing protein [Bacillus salacetis]|uniref:DUF2628 domain-containing protein n=1 Tax=Bacillus salacetis TaxID=2315464 RepID=UPI003B9E90A4
MYCSNCGEKQTGEGKYCQNCGHSLTSESIEEREAPSKESSLKTFVGKNSDYYLKKWDIGDNGPRKKISWNWAAFLTGYFWLGYRKMYGYMVIILLLWLAIDAVSYSIDWPAEALNASFMWGIMAVLGNHIYYLYAEKKIKKLEDKGTASEDRLTKAGGTSIAGVFIAIAMMIGYVFLTVFVLEPALTTAPVQFGHGEEEGIITEAADSFEKGESMFFSFDFPDYKGGAYKVVVEKRENGTEHIFNEWEDEVPPDWPGVITEIYAPEENGEYIMKIIKKDKVIAKGEFTVE